MATKRRAVERSGSGRNGWEHTAPPQQVVALLVASAILLVSCWGPNASPPLCPPGFALGFVKPDDNECNEICTNDAECVGAYGRDAPQVCDEGLSSPNDPNLYCQFATPCSSEGDCNPGHVCEALPCSSCTGRYCRRSPGS